MGYSFLYMHNQVAIQRSHTTAHTCVHNNRKVTFTCHTITACPHHRYYTTHIQPPPTTDYNLRKPLRVRRLLSLQARAVATTSKGVSRIARKTRACILLLPHVCSYNGKCVRTNYSSRAYFLMRAKAESRNQPRSSYTHTRPNWAVVAAHQQCRFWLVRAKPAGRPHTWRRFCTDTMCVRPQHPAHRICCCEWLPCQLVCTIRREENADWRAHGMRRVTRYWGISIGRASNHIRRSATPNTESIPIMVGVHTSDARAYWPTYIEWAPNMIW